jgi:hypothetical protein
MSYQRTEQELISLWLDLAKETFKEYAWAAPGTWVAIQNGSRFHEMDLVEGKDKGSLGEFIWIKPYPFAHKILMNVFAEEGFVYPAHAGTEYFQYPRL